MSRLLLATLGLLVLAVPAASGAASAPKVYFSLATSGIPVGHGYRMAIHAWQQDTYQYAPRTWLEVTLAKQRGPATQKHQWAFLLKGTALGCDLALARCTLDSRRAMKRFGRVRLTFVASTHATLSRCPGGAPARSRAGAFSGTFEFRSHSRFFDSINRFGQRGSVRIGSLDALECTPPPSPDLCGRTKLYVPPYAARGVDRQLVLAAVDSGGRAAASFWYRPLGSSEPVTHSITVKSLPTGSWNFASDLTSASFNGDAVPFFTGKLRFGQTRPYSSESSCGTVSWAEGFLAGNLAVHLDGLPAIPFNQGNGSLIRYP